MLSPKQKIGYSVLFVLMAVGLVRILTANLFWVMGIIALVSVIAYLYKYPPRWLLRLNNNPRRKRVVQFRGPRNVSHLAKKTSKKKYNKRQRSFRVIQGNKKDPKLRNASRNTKTQ
ncbi:hypothetical protein SAMN05444487_10440 [Marininema mesophilum]|uniref:Uncharacterized protein n=1 Tax=Marininema mesophilum TaxID=1048340 RepID=A0A1H2U9Z6_9BACL|nr:hypothetical protein [Marininema mesophilum]SDW52718.1 hypothetical protein SAMN05444487_10440 [Marininema mesophilum]